MSNVISRVRTTLWAHPPLRSAAIAHRRLGVRNRDVLLDSYLKVGSTWVASMLGHMVTGDPVLWDELGNTVPWVKSVMPIVGEYRHAPATLPSGGRILRSHEPYSPWYFGNCPRAIYVVRDGRDVAVSYYFHVLRQGRFDGPFSEFLGLFLDGKSLSGFGTWHGHVDSWLSSPLGSAGGLLIVRYEDLLEDTATQVAAMARLLDIDLDDARITEIVASNTADRMRTREKESRLVAADSARQDIPFVRNARTGDWREHFSDEDLEVFMAVAGGAMQRLGYVDDHAAG